MSVASIKRIRQGGSLAIAFSRGGLPIDGFVCTLYVKQFESDVATISRVMQAATENTWSDQLSNVETASLKVGLWHAFGELVNASTGEARKIASGDVRFMVQPDIAT